VGLSWRVGRVLVNILGNMLNVDYPLHTRLRASRAVACSPFRVALFQTLQGQSLSLRGIVGAAGVPHPYLQRPVTVGKVERQLSWLIQVGLLRREVDGQGITDRFRLTPLGHLLLEEWTEGGSPGRPTWGDRMLNRLSRWFGV
jgi:hypothetical protein